MIPLVKQVGESISQQWNLAEFLDSPETAFNLHEADDGVTQHHLAV